MLKQKKSRSTMVTMSQVAENAGVSQATVSFVLGGQADRLRISDETRERVQAAANSLGYQRNQLARAMITGKSRILGVLISPETPDNIARILAGAVEAASASEYMVKIIHLSWSGVDDATVSRCMEWRLAGAMVLGLSETSMLRITKEFRDKGLSMATLDNAPATGWGIRIRSNDEQGIKDVVTHLTDLGHTRIAFVGGAPGAITRTREESFRSSMSDAGLPVPEHFVMTTSWSDHALIEAKIREMFELSKHNMPTAVVCSADSIAMIVQRIARRMGIRLPDELSITGYSNMSLSEAADPSLTTVDQSFYEMGFAASTHLVTLAEANEIDNDGIYNDMLIPTRIVVRKSTTSARIS